jgi:hypothetical protein
MCVGWWWRKEMHTNFGWKIQRNRLLVRSRHILEDTLKTHLCEIACGYMEMAQDRVQLRACENTAVNPQVLYEARNLIIWIIVNCWMNTLYHWVGELLALLLC